MNEHSSETANCLVFSFEQVDPAGGTSNGTEDWKVPKWAVLLKQLDCSVEKFEVIQPRSDTT